MSPERRRPVLLPESARQTLDDFVSSLGVELQLWRSEGAELTHCLYPDTCQEPFPDPCARRAIRPRDGSSYQLLAEAGEGEPDGAGGAAAAVGVDRVATLAASTLERVMDFAQEVRFFTLELSERYEEINLLYSISETLGSILRLDEATRVILHELCDVLGAREGSLWVHEPDDESLSLIAWVGPDEENRDRPAGPPGPVTSRVFKEGVPLIATRAQLATGGADGGAPAPGDSVLSVPVRYTPHAGTARTVGVINLMGRRHGGRFTAADQKLLAAIASQVGAALENNRLIRQSLARERMASEMELAHNLQQKLLPAVDRVDGTRVAARVEPAELVGGDFYQVFRLEGGRVGVMVGDVSTHGFPAALIMALSMSAASIHASSTYSPATVLRRLDDGLREELENTEMYLSLFYGVLDREARSLTYANAGHPHAFLIRGDGTAQRLKATDPPVGFAGPEAYGEAAVEWAPESDRLFLFTDGLSDTLTSAARPDGEAFVVHQVVERRGDDPRSVVDHLFALTRDARPSIPSDDRTALLVAGA